MDPMLAWGLGLLGLALLVFAAELFIPSAGALSVLGGLCAIAGIVCLFLFDTMWGVMGSLVTLVLIPIGFTFFMKVWPYTPIGRRVIGKPLEEELGEAQQRENALRAQREALIGTEGMTVTELRPVGVALFGEQKLEVMSELGFVGAGQRVRVVAADLTQIKVRSIS